MYWKAMKQRKITFILEKIFKKLNLSNCTQINFFTPLCTAASKELFFLKFGKPARLYDWN